MQTADDRDQTARTQNFRRGLIHSVVVFLGFSVLYTLFFAPVLFSDKLLAPADGISYFLPAFYAPRTLWTDLIFGGYPIAADPQNFTWYPPALLLSLIPHSWNAFVILAYVLAGSFAYCYTYTLTASWLAAAVTGVVYSLSGFMIGHLPMAGMIHAAAWIPLVICALEKLRHRLEPGWFAIGALAVACCFLGGHPQISVYGLGLGVFYALVLGWSAPLGRWNYYRWALATFVVGVSLCAIQLLPTIELSRLSLRSEMTFGHFLTLSLPLWQALQLLFPFLFGGYMGQATTYLPYWGQWNLAELNGYVGLLPLMLAVMGTISYRNRPLVRFWLVIGILTLLLAFGGDLFLGRLLYYVPVYNKFRGQARHFVEFAMAVSVLAGFGVAAIQQRAVPQRLILKTIAASSLIMLVSLLSLAIFYPRFQAKARLVGLTQLNLLPWANAGVGIPLVIFALGTIVLLIWSRWRQSRWIALVFLAAVILDVSSFGTCWQDWQILVTTTQQLQPTPTVQAYRDALAKTHQRFLDANGTNDTWWDANAIFPNLTRLWKLPNAGGYSPLMLSRVSEMMQMVANGLLVTIPEQRERGVDLMSVRYLLTSGPVFSSPLVVTPNSMTDQKGVAWANTDLGIVLGAGPCAPPPNQLSVQLNWPDLPRRETTEVGLVTTMSCAVPIPNQTEVMQVQVTDSQGGVETHSFQVGRDTAEHAYDCPDIQPNMQHQRAKVFRSFPTSRPGVGDCQTHQYVSTLKLKRPQQIKSVELKWGKFPGLISISHISLIDRPRNRSTLIVPTEQSSRWKKVNQLPNGIVYENQQVLPRTWLVPETIPLPPEQILTAIRTSRLPDGRTYDPTTMALVEDAAARFQSSALQPTDTAHVVKIADTQVEIQTQAAAPAFLVLSDVNYPGWRATIDGQITPIVQTNYVQRGVKVPAGEHLVRFEFHPLSFKLGVGITTATCFGCGYWLLRMQRKPQTTLAD